MIAIVDYGVGNLASIKNMFKRIGEEASIVSSEEEIRRAPKLVLPGVGAFDTCAGRLESSGLRHVLEERALRDRVPVLGICVGMQLLLEGSDEGSLKGLGWIAGRNKRFDATRMPAQYKIPHMGWTDVHPVKPTSLNSDWDADARFYFVHSYHAELSNNQDAWLMANYGYDFVAGVQRENIFGVQFHPEKSHRFGMKLLHNFALHNG